MDNYLDDSSDSTQKSLDKQDGKQQATFLTKLYASVVYFSPKLKLTIPNSLLERPEYHHMIRWDPKGEQIIVERPEQLALHVLPSIYRQSRFASFSRQLNVRLSLDLLLTCSDPVFRFMASCAKSTSATSIQQ